MTKAQAATTIQAVVNAGFPATAALASDGVTWTVTVLTPGYTIAPASLSSLASGQGVSALVRDVQFS